MNANVYHSEMEHKKNSFAQVSKNLTKYENNLNGPSK